MNDLPEQLARIDTSGAASKETIIQSVIEAVKAAGYSIVDLDDQKPWGAYIRMGGEDAERFLAEFFPGLSLREAQLGMPDAELSPKLLIVAPGQRLSWQYHDRRAERWVFLTSGGYHKSATDDQGELRAVKPGESVQFARGERHRLVGAADGYTVVAEIWQHTDRTNLSAEEDIVRLADDYAR